MSFCNTLFISLWGVGQGWKGCMMTGGRASDSVAGQLGSFYTPEESKPGTMKTYVFSVEMEQDVDGRWGAGIPALPGCATWGYTVEEALEALQEAAQAYLEDMAEAGDIGPDGRLRVGDAPAVTVTL